MTMESSTPPSQFLPAQRPPRRRAACQLCYQSKVKCSRGQPCLRCQVNQKECYYELASRIGKPRGSKNRTNLRSPRPGREGETATPKADEKTFTSTARKHSIAPCTDMVDVEGQEQMDEQQYQVPLQTSAEQSWTYSPNDLNTSDLFPSFMSTGSPSQDSTIGSSFGLLSHPSSTDLPSSDSFLDSVSSLPEKDHCKSSHSSQRSSLSPSEPPTVSPPARLYSISDDAKPNLWGSIISPTPCTCLATLSDSLVRLSSPSASSIPSTLDTFLASTSALLAACSNFITCPLCPKNSLGLCLAATAFVTFMQLFTSLKENPFGTTPQSNASRTTLALGTYHIPASDSGAVHALMLQLTVRRWREACAGIRSLLRELGAKAEKREDDELGRNGDGAEVDGERGLWAARDIEFFRQLIQTVDRALAGFCKKGAVGSVGR